MIPMFKILTTIMLAAALFIPFHLYAQEIEPRAYSNAPVGMNFIVSGFADPKLRLLVNLYGAPAVNLIHSVSSGNTAGPKDFSDLRDITG
jgi:hypothetical protein